LEIEGIFDVSFVDISMLPAICSLRGTPDWKIHSFDETEAADGE
jgi:hypothetical protein